MSWFANRIMGGNIVTWIACLVRTQETWSLTHGSDFEPCRQSSGLEAAQGKEARGKVDDEKHMAYDKELSQGACEVF